MLYMAGAMVGLHEQVRIGANHTHSETLQYLDQEDLRRYLSGLVEHRDHLCNDPSYLAIFHGEYLGKVKGEKRRDIE
jgi:hypothetical protein